ncbi:hypothetical protein [uncultured Nostoc sp.]|uniref:hypothetical protein n=1 Tax=uncultured Nostoc sp. TaxID=340711 RepID=UPI0035CB2950
MTQAMSREQAILESVKALTPQQQEEVINFIEFLQYKEMQNQETVEDKEKEKQVSFLEAAKEFIGCIDGGPGDLATNKKYLEGFGR